MSSRDTAVSVQGLSKSYTIAHNLVRHSTLGETMLHRLKNPFSQMEMETFWALKDVSFDIKKGDVVGIIGRNGAGKSTLLKILSQITEPTQGQIDLYGRVGSLLEVGTGFHPELTGRENIFLNGAILGMRRKEIERQFDAIVEFAEVEQFLDTPVKRYSSGMYVRLAFAVAAHLNPEILIVDEVLAVGDAQFQKKCLGKMHDVSTQEGRTVLFVSHNMTAVQLLCNRCVLLHQGKVRFDGNTPEAILLNQSSLQDRQDQYDSGEYDLTNRQNPLLHDEIIIRKVTFKDSQGTITNTIPIGQEMTITIEVENLNQYGNTLVGIRFKSDSDQILASFNTEMKPPSGTRTRNKVEEFHLRIPQIPFMPGDYWIDLGADEVRIRQLDYVDRAARFHVVQFDVYGSGHPMYASDGVVFLNGEWIV